MKNKFFTRKFVPMAQSLQVIERRKDRMENAMITMKNINKGYMLGEERLPILKDINFQVNKGEYVAILGPSGSGKTTLMNMIGCMDVMDSGEYYLDGMAIHETKEDDLTMVRNQKIGFIFQNYQLIPTYNVMQNIIMPLLMRGMTHEEAESIHCQSTGGTAGDPVSG